jgi:hypothetical protein
MIQDSVIQSDTCKSAKSAFYRRTDPHKKSTEGEVSSAFLIVYALRSELPHAVWQIKLVIGNSNIPPL